MSMDVSLWSLGRFKSKVMLKTYLVSVVIYMIIIHSALTIFKDAIVKKYTIDKTKRAKTSKRLSTLFACVAVPIIRFFVVVFIIYIAVCKQEDFDRLMGKNNTDKS